MLSLDLHFRNTVISLPRLAFALVCLFALVLGGARVVRGEPTRTAHVLGPLNVRSGPGTEHPVVTHAGKGAQIQITEPGADGWAAVRRGRRTIGYVRALPQYVRMEQDAERRSGFGAGWLVLAALAAAGAWVVMTRGRTAGTPAPAAAAPRQDVQPWSDDTLIAPRAHPPVTATPVYAPEPVTPVMPAPSAAEETEAARNGREFEQWAALRVRRSGLALVDWRSDKFVEGVYAEANLAPDLVVEHRHGQERIRFAIECKWRSKYYRHDELHWGEWKHLHRYRKYAAENDVPVYLLIGIGGTGGEPGEVYLVPLERVAYPWLYHRELQMNDCVRGEGTFTVDPPSRRLRLLPGG